MDVTNKFPTTSYVFMTVISKTQQLKDVYYVDSTAEKKMKLRLGFASGVLPSLS